MKKILKSNQLCKKTKLTFIPIKLIQKVNWLLCFLLYSCHTLISNFKRSSSILISLLYENQTFREIQTQYFSIIPSSLEYWREILKYRTLRLSWMQLTWKAFWSDEFLNAAFSEYFKPKLSSCSFVWLSCHRLRKL